MTPNRASAIGEHLPYLRRYARAITGSQDLGDRQVALTLEAILDDSSLLEPNLPLKTALYRVMYALEVPVDTDMHGHDKTAHGRLSELTPPNRAALLLHTIEDMSHADISQIMQIDVSVVQNLIETARSEIANSIAGQILIIEDESIIAMDLASIVTEQGHTVTGVARTRVDAVRLGLSTRPDLILADVQLADKSSGIDAVNELLAQSGDIPVIFITAFPELLLTGTVPEPAYLISKPYTEAQVHSAVSQAMFFASSEGIEPVKSGQT